MAVNGTELGINVADGKLGVDSAHALKTDVEANIGVIQIIDTEVIPN